MKAKLMLKDLSTSKQRNCSALFLIYHSMNVSKFKKIVELLHPRNSKEILSNTLLYLLPNMNGSLSNDYFNSENYL